MFEAGIGALAEDVTAAICALIDSGFVPVGVVGFDGRTIRNVKLPLGIEVCEAQFGTVPVLIAAVASGKRDAS